MNTTQKTSQLPVVLDLPYHQDPGHGWIEVPLALLVERGIAARVSPYSYLDAAKGLAYLEEDCDAALLIDALKTHGETFNVRHLHTNDDSFIRSLPSFSAGRFHGRM